MNNKNIFKFNRLSFKEMWDDATNYVRRQYEARGQVFNASSPFGQLLQVLLHMGRMIIYYIEDSITELNITTATREHSIKGLTTLTGHDPSRGIAARGKLKMVYNNTNPELYDDTIVIRNRTEIFNKANGLIYTLILPTDSIRLVLKQSAELDVNIVQGQFEMQQGTASGEKLQSFNFNIGNAKTIDHFFINVYVNGVRWKSVESLFDLNINEPGCIIRTGLNGGVDVFFGNGINGAIPESGATVLIEYLKTNGASGNASAKILNNGDYWEFMKDSFTVNGDQVDLNQCLTLSVTQDIVLGAEAEDILQTQTLAPHTSRSYVLANKTNYQYFLKKLNMFSIVDVIQGYEASEDKRLESLVDELETQYDITKKDYNAAIALYGKDSEKTQFYYNEIIDISNKLMDAKKKLEDSSLDDNVIFLFLIPDIKKRIDSTSSYFTAPERVFELTEDEQLAIIDLIEQTGQRVITLENKIVKPLYPRFAVNINIRRWGNVNEVEIYNNILYYLSDYFINNERRDRIPQSDLIRIIEMIPGVDSVNLKFDADRNNINVYGDSYGVDEYGDVLLSRFTTDYFGNEVEIKDIYPLFRGGFINKNGTEYSNVQQLGALSAINVNFIGVTEA